jgi:hypothetical protein
MAAKNKFKKINATPEVKAGIKTAVEKTGYSQGAIKNLMAHGALSPTLDSDYDKNTLEVVLPVFIGNRGLLEAVLSHYGNKEEQLKILENLKEKYPFANWLRSIMEQWRIEGKELNAKQIMKYARIYGGAHSSYARSLSDKGFKVTIGKIKNRIFCAARRERQKK